MMNATLIAITIPLVSMAFIFGIIYVAVSASHRQNMAMIERGMNPKTKDKKVNLGGALGNVFFPLGFFIGFFIDKSYHLITDEKYVFLSYLIVGVFFYGLGQLIGYYIQQKKIALKSEV